MKNNIENGIYIPDDTRGRPPAPSEQRILTHSIRHEKQHRKRDLYSRRHTQAFHPRQ
nr:MAG TPA: hypothetical protein [Caudoviricetes sp.]